MAASDIAFAAAAGATALALSTTLWTWRFRRRAEARASELEARLAAVQAALSEAEAATAAFEGALIAVEGEEARLVWGDEALETAAAALEVEADSASVLQAVARIAPEHGVKLRTLLERGEPCRFLVQTSRGALVVEGRPSGAIAWVRITPAGDAVPGGKFAGLADRLPDPAWITDGRGALVWANRA